MSHKLKYRILSQPLAVCRASFDTPIPEWAQNAELFCVIRALDEVSVVCPENHVETNLPSWKIEGGWAALKLEGPFPFTMTGVLASFLLPLAGARIPIFAISTFNTDYVLIKQENLASAQVALKAAGHELAS